MCLSAWGLHVPCYDFIWSCMCAWLLLCGCVQICLFPYSFYESRESVSNGTANDYENRRFILGFCFFFFFFIFFLFLFFSFELSVLPDCTSNCCVLFWFWLFGTWPFHLTLLSSCFFCLCSGFLLIVLSFHVLLFGLCPLLLHSCIRANGTTSRFAWRRCSCCGLFIERHKNRHWMSSCFEMDICVWVLY